MTQPLTSYHGSHLPPPDLGLLLSGTVFGTGALNIAMQCLILLVLPLPPSVPPPTTPSPCRREGELSGLDKQSEQFTIALEWVGLGHSWMLRTTSRLAGSSTIWISG